jgi:uncharacterized paraquat-inducible protein A
MNVDIDKRIEEIKNNIHNFKLWIQEGYKIHAFTTFFTVIVLFILSLFIIIFEQFNFIQFYVGEALFGLSPLDTWLILSLFVFGLPVYLSIYFLINFKILEIQ